MVFTLPTTDPNPTPGRSFTENPRGKREYPFAPRVTDAVYVDIGAGLVTVQPIYRTGNMVCLDRNGNLTSPWHGDQSGQAAGPAAFGFYGVMRYQSLGGGAPFFRTLDPITETPLDNPYYDFSLAPTPQTGWQFGVEEPFVDWPGFALVISDGVPLFVHGKGANPPEPGMEVYLVDHDIVTTDDTDVTNPIVVGRTVKPLSKDPLGTTSATWVCDLTYQEMPPVPAV